MGITATYCAICGTPVNHDHYIEENQKNFSFGPEHEWLTKIIGLQGNSILHGKVEDNILITKEGDEIYVADGCGVEDILTIHEACWEITGKPKYKKIPRVEAWDYTDEPDQDGKVWSDRWEQVRPYMKQLFDFYQLKEDNKLWMITDPRTEAGAKNRKRILDTFSFQPVVIKVIDQTLPKLIEEIHNDVWRESSNIRIKPTIDEVVKKAFTKYIQIKKNYSPTASEAAKELFKTILKDFTSTLSKTAQWEKCAVVVAEIMEENACVYILYTNNIEHTVSSIENLAELNMPLTAEITWEEDSEWKKYDAIKKKIQE